MRNDYFALHWRGNVLVVVLTDPLHAGRLLDEEFACALTRLARRRRPQRLLVDLANVRLCTSELVEGLLRLRRAVAAYGGCLRVCHVRERTAEVFRVLRLHESALNIDQSLSDSLRALDAPLSVVL